MLIYRGDELEHWRTPFEGDECGQVFLHYVDSKGPYHKKYAYDGRPIIGLPSHIKKND